MPQQKREKELLCLPKKTKIFDATKNKLIKLELLMLKVSAHVFFSKIEVLPIMLIYFNVHIHTYVKDVFMHSTLAPD